MNPLEQSRQREAKLVQGLRQLATKYGTTFREPLQIDSRGEFSLVISNRTTHDGATDPTGQYGEPLAELLSQFNPRTGTALTRFLLPENGWCYMHHFDVERMLAVTIEA